MSKGYGLAEKVSEGLDVEEVSRDLLSRDLGAAIIEVIRYADVHTGIPGGKGHLGCSLCAAVKELRRRYELE